MLFLVQEEDLNINCELCVLYFYTSWIPFHKKMMIMIEKMEQKYNNIKFFAINADSFDILCKRFNVGSVPTVLILKSGEEVKRINGLVLTSAFKAAFVDI